MKLLSLFFFNKSFIKSLLLLALPLIGQNLITSSLNLLDNIMIGHLGKNSIAAVGLAQSILFSILLNYFCCLCWRKCSPITILGKKRNLQYKKICWYFSCSFNCICFILFFFGTFFPRIYNKTFYY